MDNVILQSGAYRLKLPYSACASLHISLEDYVLTYVAHDQYTVMPSKNTLGVKKGEAKSEALVNVKTTESTGD